MQFILYFLGWLVDADLNSTGEDLESKLELSFREKVNNNNIIINLHVVLTTRSPYLSHGTSWVKLCQCQHFVYFVIIAFSLITFTVDQLLML